jgi:hypothetical protein
VTTIEHGAYANGDQYDQIVIERRVNFTQQTGEFRIFRCKPETAFWIVTCKPEAEFEIVR